MSTAPIDVPSFINGILGGGGSQNGSSKGTQDQTTSKNTDSTQTDLASQIVTALTTSLATGTVKKGTGYSADALQRLFSAIAVGAGGFSKDAAIADSAGAADAKAKELINGELGNIMRRSTMSGAESSSGTSISTERLLARAAAASAGVQQQAISNYADKQLAASKNMSDILALIQDSATSSEQNQTQQNTSQQLTAALKKLLGTETGTSSTKATQDTTSTTESDGWLDSLFG